MRATTTTEKKLCMFDSHICCSKFETDRSRFAKMHIFLQLKKSLDIFLFVLASIESFANSLSLALALAALTKGLIVARTSRIATLRQIIFV